MAIDFPDNPTNGDTFTVNGKTWQWDGSVWTSYGNYLDPSTLNVDKSNGRVGINNTNPTVALDVTGAAAISSDLTVGGNFTVSGTTTTINTTDLNVEDNIITLNYGVTGTPVLDAGIEVERGDSANTSILWDESTVSWIVGDTAYVDTANNRVGIGTATPSEALDVVGNIVASGDITATGDFTADTVSSSSGNLDSLIRSACPIGSVQQFAGSASPDSSWLICDGSAVSRTTYASLFAVIGTTYGVGDNSTTFNLPNMKGRVPVGLDAGQTEFNALGETGGAKTHTLTEAELAQHDHANTLSNATVASSTHTHTGPNHRHTGPSHTHSTPSHQHSSPFPIHPSGGSGPNGIQPVTPWNTAVFGFGSQITYPNVGYITVTGSANTVSGYPYLTSSNNGGNTGSGGTGNTGYSGTGNTGGPSATTTVGITNANAGSGNAHNNLQPYIALNYIIKAL